jgi:hypothetical protein
MEEQNQCFGSEIDADSFLHAYRAFYYIFHLADEEKSDWNMRPSLAKSSIQHLLWADASSRLHIFNTTHLQSLR